MTLIYLVMALNYKSSSAKEAQGHKTCKGSLTLIPCGDDARHIGKKKSAFWIPYYLWFQAFTGDLGTYTSQIKGDYCIYSYRYHLC